MPLAPNGSVITAVVLNTVFKIEDNRVDVMAWGYPVVRLIALVEIERWVGLKALLRWWCSI